jgi:hypothetical protein
VPQLCDAFAASGHGHSHGAGDAVSQRCVHHNDLHACAEGGGRRYGKSVGLIGLRRLIGRFGRGGSMARKGRKPSDVGKFESPTPPKKGGD